MRISYLAQALSTVSLSVLSLSAVAAEPKLSSGIDKANISQTKTPGADFYEYVNDGWLQNTPIPADRSNYGAFSVLDDNTLAAVRAIIDEAVADKQAAPGSDRQKVGDFYRSYTDLARRNQLGIEPIEGLLKKVANLKEKHEVLPLAAALYREGVGTVLSVYVEPDARRSAQYAVYVGQSGLSLPDRDYYLKDEKRYLDMQAALRAYTRDMLTAAGVADADSQAQKVYELEAKLAEIQWTNVANRDPVKTYNKLPHTELASEMPQLGWPAFVRTLGFDKESSAIVQQVSFVKGLAGLIQEVPLDTWKNYFTYQVIDAYAPVLTEALERRHFDFHETTISGVAEQKPLWRRGVEATNRVIGEVLGKLYVEKHFAPQAKARMLQLVENLKVAAGQRIDALPWMGPATKKQAREKLAKFATKIGYPDKWKDYTKLSIAGDDIAGNFIRSSVFELERQIDKLGGPIDRTEWLMTPQTINAYYNPLMNEIVFPAAILQPPFFNMAADDAVNYGGIGAVIGHELSHGFDDQGSQYDGDGNLRKWWTEEDRGEFERRAKDLIGQYNTYKPFEDMAVNGELTLGENIGDLGGLNFAYSAYQNSLGGQPAPVIDGLTGDQRFFLGWAQVWRRLYREPELRRRLLDDPHSPSRYRVNGIVSNMDAFYAAFDVKPGEPMYIAPETRVRIW
ncbi:MAG: M13 family metallopeptidase [Pirellulaceae bacterium]|nr:M13 family metallopeptidase [Pirellulaceae bacterium]